MPINITKKKPQEPGIGHNGGPAMPVVKFAEIGNVSPLSTRAAIQSQVDQPEDEYRNWYIGQNADKGIIMPPFDLRRLDGLCNENNALGPCIDAMVTNVDGTGFDLVKDSPHAVDPDTTPDDTNVDELWDFFSEPYPGESFITQRKQLRRHIKRTGNGYIEVIRNPKDDILFTRIADSKMMRICKLSASTPTEVVVKRGGKQVKVTMLMRWHSYVQYVNGIGLHYFKEFGCPLDIDTKTGKWSNPGERLPAAQRGNEIIHFVDVPDAYSPYGVPCWINQMPSVLGSRKAEELNLDFFDNGGVPPILILLQGGVLSNQSKVALEQRLMYGPAAQKNRVQVVEMEPTVGSLDGPTGSSRVTVERFGAEKQNDSMFEKYDDKCETRIRRSFRLAPIFIGHASDYSFATAYASYTVGEAQTFRPERDEFDEIMSVKFIPALGYPGYRMQSKPLVIEDATLKLQGIEIAQTTQQVDAGEILDAVNETVGTRLKVSTTLPVPQTLIQGPPIKAVPGGSQASPGGKAGISLPPKPGAATSATRSATGGTATKKPSATPTRRPSVQKSEAEIADIVVRTLAALGDKDFAKLGGVLVEVRDLDDQGIAEAVDMMKDLSGAGGSEFDVDENDEDDPVPGEEEA